MKLKIISPLDMHNFLELTHLEHLTIPCFPKSSDGFLCFKQFFSLKTLCLEDVPISSESEELFLRIPEIPNLKELTIAY